MATHELHPTRATLHGAWSPDLAPALVVDPGETVVVRTIDVAWGLEPPTSTTAPRKKLEPHDPERDDGPALTGPIAVRGAEPGMTLDVEIIDVVPGEWGFTYAARDLGDPALNRARGIAGEPLPLLRWSIDRDAGVATDQAGRRVPIRPFPGTIGVAPPACQSGWRPHAGLGNIDCRELVAGSTLCLPVLTPGALLSVGDGHAAQGDGELGGTAIECPLDRIELRLSLRDDAPIGVPHARTPAGWVTFGFDEDLDVAIARAAGAMLDLMQRRLGVTRPEAAALASVCVDLRLTQLVNGLRGVHALWAR